MTESKTTLPDLAITAAIRFWRRAESGQRDNAAFNDTELAEEMEILGGRRLERGTIARVRARLEDRKIHPNPLIVPAGEFVWQGRKLHHSILSAAGRVEATRRA